MSKHTPGPWTLEVYEQTEEWEGECSVIIGEGKGQDEVFVHDEANARLIAAAPDLYDALVALDAALDFGDPIRDDEVIDVEDVSSLNRAMLSARAAIAKARGD